MKESARQNQLHRAKLTGGFTEALRAARAGNHADVDLGLTELRAFARHDHVAVHGQLATTPEAKTVDGRNDGLAHFLNTLPTRKVVALVHIHDRGFGHFFDVRPGSECLGVTR